MSVDRVFLDTAYLQALIDRRDQHHRSAVALRHRTSAPAEVWITEAVLIEIGNALSTSYREDAIDIIEQSYRTSNVRVIPLTTALLLEALDRYRARLDKEWGRPTVSHSLSCGRTA